MVNGLIKLVAEELRRPGGEALARVLGLEEALDAAKGPPTMTAAELLARDFPEPAWVIPGLLPEGLTLVGGRPKMGKSWLALGLALSVASGGVALSKVRVERGEALYLGLEDTARRLKRRLEMMLHGDPAPDGLHLATAWPRLHRDGLLHLENFLREHPGTRLIIIDTLAKVRAPGNSNAGLYADDYAVLSGLKALADAHGIAVLVVHHLNKRVPTEDPLDAVSGTTGLTGCADSVWLLRRERGRADANLLVTGRDFEEQDLALQFDAGLGLWSLLGSAEEYRMSKERQEIVEVLRDGEPLTPKEIAEALGRPYAAVRMLLFRMAKAGEVKATGRGRYTHSNSYFSYPVTSVTSVTSVTFREGRTKVTESSTQSNTPTRAQPLPPQAFPAKVTKVTEVTPPPVTHCDCKPGREVFEL